MQSGSSVRPRAIERSIHVGRMVAVVVVVLVSSGYHALVEEHEVYPNAPVVLVALEARHPPAGPLSRSAQQNIKRDLAAYVPLLMTTTITNFQATIGAQSEITTEHAPKYFSRDKATAITFRSEAVVIETTRYENYERFRDLVRLAIRARQKADPVDGVVRLGLRYIDEVRVPEVEESRTSWAEWVSSSLIGAAPIGEKMGLTSKNWQGLAVFGNGQDRELALRYGPREGYAVDPAGDLKRSTPAPGPYFLLDIDSFWTPSDDVPVFDEDKIVSVCDDLHSPVRDMFEGLITERLRQEVLRNVE